MTFVKAPATSANIGAGFDTAAVAFDLWNKLEVTGGEGVVIEGEGAAELPADDSNLAVRAYALLADPAGKRFRFVNRIPLERGLGSSAAAIALGLVAAAPDASAEELLAVGRHARAARRQPRGGAARRPHASPGTGGSPGSPSACRSSRRSDPARADLDRELPADAPRHRPARRSGRERRPGRAARSGRGERRRGPLRGRARRLAARAVSPVRDARGDPRRPAARAAPARRCPGRARP